MKVKVPTTGLEIEYEAHGDPSHPAFLCVMGLGGALTIWRPSFVQRIVDLGYYVIRFDNRDVGLSTHLDGSPVTNFKMKAICSILCGACCFPSKCCGTPESCCLRPTYTVADMAEDAVGLLDALGIEKAVVLGGSMGGMITQYLLLNHTHRVSAAILAFTSGKFPLPHPSIRGPIMRPVPLNASMDELLAATFEKQTLLAGPAQGMRGRTEEGDFEHHKEIYTPTLQRKNYYTEAEGKARQSEAIICSERRFGLLKKKFARRASSNSEQSTSLLDGSDGLPPVVLFHGHQDLMIDIQESRLLHQAIPGSTLIEIEGMGHEIHPVHFDEVVDIIKNVERHHGAKFAAPPANAGRTATEPTAPSSKHE